MSGKHRVTGLHKSQSGNSDRRMINGARQALAKTFLRRSVKMLERLSSAASPEALQAALCSATDVGGVASLLSDVAPLGLDLSSVDPFAEALARGVAVKQQVLERA